MRTLTPIIAAVCLPIAAFAGTSTFTDSVNGKTVQPLECTPNLLDEVIATTDYGFHQKVERGNGTLQVEHNDIEVDRRIPLDFLSWPNVQCGGWFMRLGADYGRFDFSLHDAPHLPDTLQSVSGLVALEYMVNNNAAFMIETQPGVFFEHKINAGSFDAPTRIAVAYPVFGGDKFYLIAGVTVSALLAYPVLPIGGVLWHINDNWDLRAYLPNPRLVYQYSPNFELWAGGELVGGAYKTDFRTVKPQTLSGAAVTYYDARVGAGLTWRVKPVTFDLGAGYTVWSAFDYNRAIQNYSTHPAPYVRLTARLDF